MNALSFIFKRAINGHLSNLVLGMLNVAVLASLYIILGEFGMSDIRNLKYIFQFFTLLLITSAIILSINSEIVDKIRDICILRAIGLQKYFVWLVFIIKSISIGLIGSIIGILIGSFSLLFLFNIAPKLLPILNMMILGVISVLISSFFPLIKLSKLKIPEVLNR